MAERVAVRDISNEKGNKLLSIIPRGSGSVVRWRRAQIVLWSAQHMDVPAIAKIAFTSEGRFPRSSRGALARPGSSTAADTSASE